MRNIKIILEYDGTKYKGWQKLSDNEFTIQGKLETTLSRICEEEISVIGCSRTDAGVHALNYVANFHTKSTVSTEKIMHDLNKYLSGDIVIKSAKDCSERFHARYNALSKTYRYVINNSTQSAFSRKYELYIIDKLDVEKMIQASKYLIGTHDFQSFTTLKSKKKSTVKTIHSIDIFVENSNIIIEVKGNSFLWNMVRIICGTLIEVGKGTILVENIDVILKECKRQEAGPNAAAQGLFLKEVEY